MKKEFRVRLERLKKALDESLECDYPMNSLFPMLYQAFMYMWCKNPDEVVTQRRKLERIEEIKKKYGY